ncbi:ras family-domain-containing protein [Melanogaster broomeanus]|nr:ras family-domain-containing protein [Melanogaster broomeanus]
MQANPLASPIEEYATLRDQWIHEGQAFILVYSITSRSTFERIQSYHQSMLKAQHKKPVFVLVGNKCDSTHERKVSREEGIALEQSFDCEFMETSAQTSYNVALLFTNLVHSLRQAGLVTPAIRQATKPAKGCKKSKCVVM